MYLYVGHSALDLSCYLCLHRYSKLTITFTPKRLGNFTASYLCYMHLKRCHLFAETKASFNAIDLQGNLCHNLDLHYLYIYLFIC